MLSNSVQIELFIILWIVTGYLNHFDTILRNRESWNYIAFSVMLLRKCVRKKGLNHFNVSSVNPNTDNRNAPTDADRVYPTVCGLLPSR